MRRWRVVLATLAATLAVPGVAHADPAEATDYRTTVRSIEPRTPGVRVDVVGGDSFLRLTVNRGTQVVVLGYQDEPFLRIRGNGRVQENRRSPTLFQSESRYGGGTAPLDARADAEPEWVAVGSGGTYAWHDHRSHWMDRRRPAGAAPGDVVVDDIVPLLVDGERVEVRVVSRWLPAPSRLPLLLGAALGGALVVVALATRRRLAWVLLVAGGGSTAVGWWQFASLPPETGPRPIWWVLPALATACAAVGIVLGRRLVSYALVILGALELAVWVVLRRDGLLRAILPTDAPFWLDRAVTVGAGVVAVAAAATAVLGLLRSASPLP